MTETWEKSTDLLYNLKKADILNHADLFVILAYAQCVGCTRRVGNLGRTVNGMTTAL